MIFKHRFQWSLPIAQHSDAFFSSSRFFCTRLWKESVLPSCYYKEYILPCHRSYFIATVLCEWIYTHDLSKPNATLLEKLTMNALCNEVAQWQNNQTCWMQSFRIIKFQIVWFYEEMVAQYIMIMSCVLNNFSLQHFITPKK